MNRQVLLAFFGIVMLVPAFAASQQQPGPIRGQMPDLGRPTQSDDPLPLFNFENYFIGKWSFDWDVPEGPLGPAGTIGGTTAYTAIEGGFYKAETEATGPAGPLIVTELIAYHKPNKTLARYVTDSRGFSFLQISPIGADLGGYYNIYYESAPFIYNTKSIRIRTAMHLLSPVNYKVTTTLSVAGGPFMNYGSTWWRKNIPGAPGR
jgi:hypothetical protein